MKRARQRPGRTAIALAAILCVLTRGALADADSLLSRVPLPSDARLYLVADDLVQNGRRMAVATFVSASSVDDTLAWYKARWPADADGPGHVESQIGGWQIVSHLHQGANTALQLKPSAGGGSRGLLSVMPLEDLATVFEPPPMPPGARLLSDTRVDDPAGQALTQVLHAPGGPGEVAAFYRDRLQRGGWSVRHISIGDNPAVILFSSNRGRMEMVATSHIDSGTLVFLNSVTRER